MLSNSRLRGDPIQLSEILIYTTHFDIIGDKQSFVYIIQKLDQVFLASLEAKTGKKEK